MPVTQRYNVTIPAGLPTPSLPQAFSTACFHPKLSHQADTDRKGFCGGPACRGIRNWDLLGIIDKLCASVLDSSGSPLKTTTGPSPPPLASHHHCSPISIHHSPLTPIGSLLATTTHPSPSPLAPLHHWQLLGYRAQHPSFQPLAFAIPAIKNRACHPRDASPFSLKPASPGRSSKPAQK